MYQQVITTETGQLIKRGLVEHRLLLLANKFLTKTFIVQNKQ